LECLRAKEDMKRSKEEELTRFKDSDPRVFEEKGLFMFKMMSNYVVRLVQLYKEAANRVTDNIWSLHSYFTRRFGVNRDDLNNQFCVDEDELEDLI
jgi:hypothetical protein